jgi:cytochrome c oxidase subunit 4
MSDPHDHDAMHPAAEGAIQVHIVPPKVLLQVWGALLFLTVVTVAVTEVNLGSFALAVALLIAAVKATVVALFFMHLRWDRPFLGVVFVTSLFFVALFIIIAMMDTQIYQAELIPDHAPALDR